MQTPLLASCMGKPTNEQCRPRRAPAAAAATNELSYNSCAHAVVASEKGVVVGRLQFEEDGDPIDCQRMGIGGKAIPSNTDKAWSPLLPGNQHLMHKAKHNITERAVLTQVAGEHDLR